MKRFVAHIIGFLTLVVVFATALDYVYTKSFNTGFSRNKIQYVVQLKNTHIDYIFLGSSRVENHIDCDLITKLTNKSCVNLGLQGSKVSDAAALLQILHDNDVRYEKVLFQLDYAVNFENISPTTVSYLVPFLFNDALSEELVKDLDLPFKYNLPFYRYTVNDKYGGIREVIQQYLNKKSDVSFTNGFVPLAGTGTATLGSLPDTVVAKSVALDKMKSISKPQIVFFTAPYCKSDPNRDTFKNKLDIFYKDNLNLMDVYDNNPEYFVNCGHLNDLGAKHFTVLLTEKLSL